MSDDILARAKMLAQAANLVAEQMVQQANEFKAQSDIRHREVEIEQTKIRKEHEIQESHRSPTKEDIGTNKIFRGAAICGSSLVTTFTDIRPFTKRGTEIIIDGVPYRLADKGEWSGNRVELSSDFQGPTNYEATIEVSVTEETVNRRKSKKVVAHPVPSSDIARAVQNLNDGPLFSSVSTTYQSNRSKKSPSKHNQMTNAPPRKSPIQTAHRAPSTHSGENKNKNMPYDKVEVLPPSTVEEARMLDELRYEELYAQDEIRRKREEMHKRLAEKGQLKAAERAHKWLRKKVKSKGGINAEDDLEPSSDISTHNHETAVTGSGSGVTAGTGNYYSEDLLEEQRRLALARALKKKREDAAAALLKLEEEEAAKKKLKDVMEEKAEALRQLTQQRVAELYRTKRRQERERVEKEEADRADREERQVEQRAADRVQRVKQLKAETELRLKQRQEGEQLRRLQEQLDMDLRLKELAEVRGRVFPMSSHLCPQQQPLETERGSGFPTHSPRGAPTKPSVVVQLPGSDVASGVAGRLARGRVREIRMTGSPAETNRTSEDIAKGGRKRLSDASRRADLDTIHGVSSVKLPSIFNGSHSQKNLTILQKPLDSVLAASDSLRSMSAPKDPKEGISRSALLVQSSRHQKQQQQQQLPKQPRNASDAVTAAGRDSSLNHQKENKHSSSHNLNCNFYAYDDDGFEDNENGENSEDDFLSIDSFEEPGDRKKQSSSRNPRQQDFPAAQGDKDNRYNPPNKSTAGIASKGPVDASISSLMSSVSGAEDSSKATVKKKPKHPVWKLAPIPIRPFVPLVANSVY